MSENLLNCGEFVLDENSVAMGVIKSNSLLSESLSCTNGEVDFDRWSRIFGMSLDEYVHKCRRDLGKTADKTYAIERSVYGVSNLHFWAKYQMTYIVKLNTARAYTKEYIVEEPDVSKIKLPFPAVMVILDFDNDPRCEGHSVAYIICKRDKDKFDVTTVVDGEMLYFPICEDTITNLVSERFTEYGFDPFARAYLNWAWHVILFLAAYNRNRKIEAVRRIKLKGKNGVKAESSDYFFGDATYERVTYTSAEKEGISAPGSALSVESLIPPSERQEEIVVQKGMHKSPNRHLVSGHYRTYWTGKGRKTPVRKFIEAFERGGKVGDRIASRVKIYE